MPKVTNDDLHRAIVALSSPDRPIVPSMDVKTWFDRQGIDWGAPQGWPIKDAENAEFASEDARFVRFKCGPHDNSRIGFALAEHLEEAKALAGKEGWRLLR